MRIVAVLYHASGQASFRTHHSFRFAMTQRTPALGDTDAWVAFTARVTALVGDDDPLYDTRGNGPELRSLIGSVPRHALDQTERPGGWSVVGVVEHLADAELVFGYRLRQILTLDRPALESFDQDRWSDLGAYNDGDVTAALETLACLRRRHLRLWQSASGSTVGPCGDPRGSGAGIVALNGPDHCRA